MQTNYFHNAFDEDSLAIEGVPELSHNPKTMSLPLDPPSREDWQSFKLMIIDLYIGQNMPLRELVRYMEYHHAFRAT